MAQPTLNSYTLPYPTNWKIFRVDGEVSSTSLNGTSKSDIFYRKYKYVLQYESLTKSEFEIMQSNINAFLDAGTTPTFTYDKIGEASSGVVVLPGLSDAERTGGAGNNYLIKVNLELLEVNSR